MSEESPVENAAEEDGPAQGAQAGSRLRPEGSSPEPPARYRPRDDCRADAFSREPSGQPPRLPESVSTRRLVSAAKIMALVSLVVGGVILSSASIIVAVVAYRRILQSGTIGDGTPWNDLKRSAIAAIAVSVLALVLNVATLAVIYPMVIEMLESGDYASLWGSSASSAGSNDSFWG